MGAFVRFLTEGLLESKKTYMDRYVRGDASRKAVVDRFWNEIRHRVKAPENDIDWWIKKPFEDLEKFVSGFDARNRSQRRTDQYVRKAEEYGAKLLGEYEHYELWYVPSYEAAVQLGRFYKGISAKWCISTDNPSYFNGQYADSEFVFAIYDDPAKIPVETPDYYEKLAFQIDLSDPEHLRGDDRVWDVEDNDVQYDDDFIPYAPVLEKAVDLLVASGMTRQKFRAEFVEKRVRDREWLAENVFRGVLSPEYAGDGSVSFACSLDYLTEAFYPVDGRDQDGVSFSTISEILKYEYFDAFRWVEEREAEYDVPSRCVAGFDKKMAPYGLSWKKVLDVRFGRPVDGIDDRLYGIVGTKFSNEDGSEDFGYETAYSDAAVTGTGNNARKDIMRVLKHEFGAESCEYDETAKQYLLKCVFSPYLVKLAVKGYLAAEANDEPFANALQYVRTGDDGEMDPLSIQEPYDDWLDIDWKMVEQWIDGFADSVIAAYEKQDDLKGQAFFDFDKDYLDNPKNLKRSGLKEEEKIADNATYLANMKKSFGDKAWFLDYAKPFEWFVDFGGGAGEFCEYVRDVTGDSVKFAVIDNNPEFLSQAAAKGFASFSGMEAFAKAGIDPSSALLNMSSVIHEVYSYADPFYDDVGTFWSEVKKCGFGQIAIRDMNVSESDFRNVPVDAVIWVYENVFRSGMQVNGYVLDVLTDSFEDEWGAICDPAGRKVNVRNLIHFLIKYRYGRNWAREVKENYLPVSQDRLQGILKGMGYSLVHKESSKLPFYAKAWAKDFKLNRPSPRGYAMDFLNWLRKLNTHIKWLAVKV